MAKTFLCLDFGAFTCKAAEFELNEAGSLRLVNYALKTLGPDGFREEGRDELVTDMVKEMIEEVDFNATEINVCAPGFQVFSKFVKLPSVDAAKVNQIIQFEAQQNVPFPLDEVVWDYQILGTTPNDELEILLVAIRNEVVEGILKIGEGAGLNLQLVDVSSAALANSYRYNYGDTDECVMLLDIGAKSSNLLFFEQGRIFSRGINIGANSITQDFATEAKLDWDEAERLKIGGGFVSLGGAYEEPDNPNQALISKIARQVMTRLHVQMNQTIQFYRGQQGGSPPQKLYLAGGASLLPYTAQFFAEKLNIPVDYFNPFRNIQIDDAINLEDIAKVAHTFGEVVGLGIRNLAQCPVDLNLMPISHIRRVQLNSKRVYFGAAVLCMSLTIFSFGLYSKWVAGQANAALMQLKEKFEPVEREARKLAVSQAEYSSSSSDALKYVKLIEDRPRWAQVLEQIQNVLLATQTNHGVVVDSSVISEPVLARVWVEQMTPSNVGTVGEFEENEDEDMDEYEDEDMDEDEDGMMLGVLGNAFVPPDLELAEPGAEVLGYLNLNVRALNLLHLSPTANQEFCYKLQDAFKSNTLFKAEHTGLYGDMDLVREGAATFGFKMVLALNKPLVVN